jgi:hypothetical protein
MRLYVGRDSMFTRGHLELFKLVVVDGIIIVWLVYGNRIFYSKANDCGEKEGTRFLTDLMQTFLIIGYIMMGFYSLILCTLPCLYFYLRA